MAEGALAQELVPAAVWARIAPLLPPEPPQPQGGRPRVADRAALPGILFVRKTGLPWSPGLPRWGVGAGCRAGAGGATGTKRAPGARCTRCFSQSWPRPIASTGTGPRWTPPRCRPRRARKRARTQRIAANPARSALLGSSPTAARSRSWGAPRTGTISKRMRAPVAAITPIRAQTRGRPRRGAPQLPADQGYSTASAKAMGLCPVDAAPPGRVRLEQARSGLAAFAVPPPISRI